MSKTLRGLVVGGAVASALFVSLSTSAAPLVATRFTLPNSALTSTKVVPGDSVAFDVRLDTDTQTVGAAFRITQATPPSNSWFTITARDFTNSIYTDTNSGTADHCPSVNPGIGCANIGDGVLDTSPNNNPLLQPNNAVNLGRNTTGLGPAVTGNDLFIEKITMVTNAATPLGTYTITPLGGASFVTSLVGDDYAMTGTLTVVVGQTLTVVKAGAGAALGTVTALTGDINCGAVCSDIYPGGTVTLHASVSGIGIFSGWSSASAGFNCPGVADCTVTVDAAKTVTATFTLPPPSLQIKKISLGGIGAFDFSGNNGVPSITLTTVTAGVSADGAVTTLTSAGVATTITEASPPAGFALSNVSCTGLNGGTATPNLGARSVTLDATATASGNAIVCTFTNAKVTTLTVSKTSIGGTDTFGFTGTNGVAAHNITTVTSGVPQAGTSQTLTTSGVVTTVTENAPPAGWVLTGIACTGLNGGTATPNIATRTVSLDATATAQGNAIACTFTNKKQFVLTVSKTGNAAAISGVTSDVGGINCGATCNATYLAGDVVILSTTVPAGGTTFNGWSGAGCSGTGTCTVTMDAAKTATADFTDTVLPVTSLDSTPPNPTSNPQAVFTFSSNEPGTFECSMDGSSFAACTSPAAYPIGNGPHTFAVRAKDLAGNTGNTVTYQFTAAGIPTSIPTLSEWMLALLALMLAGLGVRAQQRRRN